MQEVSAELTYDRGTVFGKPKAPTLTPRVRVRSEMISLPFDEFTRAVCPGVGAFIHLSNPDTSSHGEARHHKVGHVRGFAVGLGKIVRDAGTSDPVPSRHDAPEFHLVISGVEGAAAAGFLPKLPRRYQVRDQTCLDFKHRRGGPGMTDVPQLIGGQIRDCPTS
jgi:hypothetical protein